MHTNSWLVLFDPNTGNVVFNAFIRWYCGGLNDILLSFVPRAGNIAKTSSRESFKKLYESKLMDKTLVLKIQIKPRLRWP